MQKLDQRVKVLTTFLLETLVTDLPKPGTYTDDLQNLILSDLIAVLQEGRLVKYKTGSGNIDGGLATGGLKGLMSGRSPFAIVPSLFCTKGLLSNICVLLFSGTAVTEPPCMIGYNPGPQIASTDCFGNIQGESCSNHLPFTRKPNLSLSELGKDIGGTDCFH